MFDVKPHDTQQLCIGLDKIYDNLFFRGQLLSRWLFNEFFELFFVER